jgi:hypothetical protein
MSFEDLEKVYKKWLSLDADPDLLRLLISIPIANRLEGNPVWAILIGKSGSGKSQLLTGFEKCNEVVVVDALTAPALLSGFYSDGANDSLLFRANGKTAVIKDFSPILMANKEAKDQVFSLLRAAYDGRVERFTGKGKLSWYGKIGIVAATTPSLEKERQKEPLLGERFINIRTKIEDAPDLMDLVFSGTTKKPIRDNELQDATAAYLDNFPTPAGPHSLPRETKDLLTTVARALAKARTGVDRNSYSKDIEFPAEVQELPTRLVSQFILMALAFKYTGATPENVNRVIMRLLNDGIPYTRLRVLKAILGGRGSDSQQDMARWVGISQATMSRALEEMSMLKIIQFNKSWTIVDPIIAEAIRT